jgi:hypothetical protein
MAAKVSFTPKAAKKIVEAVKKINSLPPNLFGTSKKPPSHKESIFFVNHSDEVAPLGGIIWLYEMPPDQECSGKKPNGSYLPMFGIVAEDTNPCDSSGLGGIGNCFISGVHKVLVSLETYENYAALLGTYLEVPSTESWEAEPVVGDSSGEVVSGRMLIVGQDPDIESSMGPFYLLARIGGGGGGSDGSYSRQVIEVRMVAKWCAYLGD